MNTMPIWLCEGIVKIIDQTKLPEECLIIEIKDVKEMWVAIKDLQVRGAPAIGLAGAFGVYIGVKQWSKNKVTDSGQFLSVVKDLVAYLDTARPTAVNLHWALMRMQTKAENLYSKNQSCTALADSLLKEAELMLEEDIASCKLIGEYGADLLQSLPNFQAFLTHCNAGALATSKYGTALAPAYVLKERGEAISVYSDETRPLLQGSRLTAWELSQAGIPVTTICDNMAGVVMEKGLVQAVITGADRIAGNGDTANKIGTYGLAILAKEHNIPFYIAAPLSTIDIDSKTGKTIPIEERAEWEVRHFGQKLTTAPLAAVFNPAFDVTPNRYISGIITEKGILYPPFSRSIAMVKESGKIEDKPNFKELQEKVAEYGRKLSAAKLVSASFGNISMLDESRSFLAITPSGIFYEDLEASDICVVDYNSGTILTENNRKPSSELPMHKAVYESRADVFAVIHTHSIYATVVASVKMEEALPMLVTELCMIAPDGIKVADFAMPGSELLAEKAVRALGENNACLLANHGTLCCGDSLSRAFTTAAILEEGAKVYVIGKQFAALSPLSPSDCQIINKSMGSYGSSKSNK